MRHKKNKFKRLGKGMDHRRKLLRSLASAVILYEKIETSEAQAKAIRSYVDRMISKAKAQTLHGNRQVMAGLSKNAARKTIEVLKDRFMQRTGGYTRILIAGRFKDGMRKYLVELV